LPSLSQNETEAFIFQGGKEEKATVIGCPLLSQNETEAFIFFRAGKRRKQL
jgi:hypothetical protein